TAGPSSPGSLPRPPRPRRPSGRAGSRRGSSATPTFSTAGGRSGWTPRAAWLPCRRARRRRTNSSDAPSSACTGSSRTGAATWPPPEPGHRKRKSREPEGFAAPSPAIRSVSGGDQGVVGLDLGLFLEAVDVGLDDLHPPALQQPLADLVALGLVELGQIGALAPEDLGHHEGLVHLEDLREQAGALRGRHLAHQLRGSAEPRYPVGGDEEILRLAGDHGTRRSRAVLGHRVELEERAALRLDRK